MLSALVGWRIATSEIRGKISSIDTELDRLTAEQAKRQRELDDLGQKVQEAQQQLVEIRAEMEYQRCEAKVAEIQSATSLRKATCFSAFAEFAQCGAEQEAKKAKGATRGALLGAFFAATGGGGALLLPVAGAMLGGAGKEGNCTAPSCETDPAKIEAAVLQEQGLRQPPKCIRSVPTATVSASAPRVPSAPRQYTASFRCSPTSNRVEVLICSTPSLGALDGEMAEVFRQVLNRSPVNPAFVRAQNEWRHGERDRCETASCVEQAYRHRIAALRAGLPSP